MANQVIVTNTGNVQVAIEPTPNVQVQISRAAIGTVSNVPTANYANYAGEAFDVSVANVSGIGNIAVVNLNGNAQTVLQGDGTFGPSGSNSANFANYANFAGEAFSVSGSNVNGAVNLANFATTANSVAGSNVSGQVGFAAVANAVAGANVSGIVANANYAAYSEQANNANLSTFATTANSVAGANVSGQVANALVAGTVYTNAQPNITSLGTITGLTSSGNISAPYFLGNVVGNISGNLVVPGTNTSVLFNQNGNAGASDAFQFNYATNVATILGNLSATNISGNGAGLSNITGANVSGTVANATYATNAGTAYSVSGANVSGDVSGANHANVADVANSVSGSNVSGAVGLATYATTANAVAGANVSGQVSYAAVANSVAGANVSGDVSGANHANVSDVANSVSGSNVSGAVNLATYATTANAVAGANVSGAVSYATTANSVALANVSGAGNIASLNLDGSSSNVLYGNGIFAAIPTISNVANANYANFAGTAYSVSGANVSGEVANANYATYAGTAYSVSGSNVSGQVANANYATFAGTAYSVSGSNVSGDVSGANHANVADTANSVSVGNVSGIGNIATINLDGNVSNILHGNGYWGPESGSLNANYANFAGQVVDATQSNITSVGTLSNLQVSGNINGKHLILTDDAGPETILLHTNPMAGGGAPGIRTTSFSNTIASPAPVANGDYIFQTQTMGYTGRSGLYGPVPGYGFAGDLAWHATNQITSATVLDYTGSYVELSQWGNDGTNDNLYTYQLQNGTLSLGGFSPTNGFAATNTNFTVKVQDPSYATKSYTFDNTGNITLPTNSSYIKFANGAPYNNIGNTLTTGQIILNATGAGQPQFTMNGDGTYQSRARLKNAEMDFVVENADLGNGFSPFFFSQFSPNNSIGPIRNFRSRGTESAKTSVAAGDYIVNESYDVYADSGNTYKGVGSMYVSVISNDGAGNVPINLTYVSSSDSANSLFDVSSFGTSTLGNLVTANYFSGDGSLLSNISGANISGSVPIRFQVKNTSGGILTRGTPVYITGTVGSTIVVEVAASRADTSSTMGCVGLLESTLNNNDFGYAVSVGTLSSYDTSTFAVGDELFVGATGGLANTRPTNNNIVQAVGTVGRVNSSTGSVEVNIWDIYSLPNLDNGNIWVGDSGNGYPVQAVLATANVGNSNYASYAGNVTIAAQANITSLGNLVSLNINNGVAGSTTKQFDPNGIAIGSTANTNLMSNSSFVDIDYGNGQGGGNVLLGKSSTYLKARGNASSLTAANVSDRVGRTNYMFYNGTANVLAAATHVNPGQGVTFNTNANAITTAGQYAIITGNPNGDQGNANALSNQNLYTFDPFGRLSITQGAAGSTSIALNINTYGGSGGNAAAGAQTIFFSRARGNRDGNLSVQPNDQLGGLLFAGHNGTSTFSTRTAAITALVDSSYTANTANIPAGLRFTTCDNTTTYNTVFSSGGNTSFPGAITATNGITITMNNISTVNPSFAFSTYNNANSLVNPYTFFRARGNTSTPAAAQVNDVVSTVGYNIYADSGNTYKTIATTGVIVSENDGAGNASATYSIDAKTITLNGNVTANNVSINTSGFMKLASYTSSALTAITGSIGWMAAVNNSTPGGMLAYWDTTNARWSYVHDNSAV